LYHLQQWEKVLHVLSTWPFVSMNLNSNGAGMPKSSHVQYSSYDGTGRWEEWVGLSAAEKAGRSLSEVERRHAILARPPPVWLMPQDF
jgi:hypothetical protein